jgi:SAM-dependent methyltransferase
VTRVNDLPDEDFLATNRDLWDAWTDIHRLSRFYDVDAFRSGKSTLKSIELEAVGNVTNKRLLHLQCHFGLDTLSWARLGARVTGVDFSARSITLAQSLARDQKLDATFHCANVLEPPAEWSNEFDIVFASYGVLAWLPDLDRWATVIAHVLCPGGSFHLVEFHPFATMLDDDGRTLRHPYFHSSRPSEYQAHGSYAEPEASFEHAAFEWAHSLSDVLTALQRSGLAIRDFREYPYSPYGCFPFLEQVDADRWKVRGAEVDIPLTFSIHALKPVS